MRLGTVMAVAFGTAAYATSALSASLDLPLTSCVLVETEEGKSNLLIPLTAPSIDGDISLGEVQLRISRREWSPDRDMRLRVRLLTSPTYRTEEDLDAELVGRLSVEPGGTLSDIDMSNVIRGVLGGRSMYGFVVTTPDGLGFDNADAAALLNAFQEATLEISYRRVPPAPRG